MPTITALSQVTSNELIGLDNAYLPIVSSGQTKKLKFEDMRNTLIPKVLQQAVAGNSDELTFNNPSSLKVDVYGRVTAVTEGGGTPIRIEGIQLDSQDFEGGGTVINQGTPYITHKVRFPLAAGNFNILPPFKANKSGHLTEGLLISDPTLYNSRTNLVSTLGSIGLGAALQPQEIDPDLNLLLATVEAGAVPTTISEFQDYFRAVVVFTRRQEKQMLELMDRLNRVMYVLNQFNLGFNGGYTGVSDTANIEHRSQYLGLFNFVPISPTDSVTNPWDLVTNANPLLRYYTLSMFDSIVGQVNPGIFKAPLQLAPVQNASARIWKKMRIVATYTPMAVFADAAYGGYAGSVQSIDKTYEFTEANLVFPSGSGTNWSTVVSGNNPAKNYVQLKSPTIQELRTVNASFATGNDGGALGSDDYIKNTVLINLTYSGVADAYWIPSASTGVIPNPQAVGQEKTISFGTSGLVSKTVLRAT